MEEQVRLTDEHQQKLRQPLERIEQAQRLVLSADEDVSAVGRFVHEWEATAELYETIKAHWYAVERHRATFTGDVAGVP